MISKTAITNFVMCPYFKSEKTTGLSCTGILDDTVCFRSIFQNKELKYNHMESFCTSFCWKGCPIAQMLQEMNR